MDTEKQPTPAVSRALAIVPATASNVTLPAVSEVTGDMLTQITGALGVPRDVVAQDDQIGHAWSQLPRLVRRIPPHLRDERIVRACIAVATGLFDAAINYIWNAAVLALREKVRDFGLHVIPQILDDRSFDEASLVDLKDADLLELCHKLNLITGQAYHFLDQCRATRNSYSVAHPSDGTVDEDEVVYFISQCQKYALSNVQHSRGVDTKALLGSLSAAKFSADQLNEWETHVRGTFDAQRQLIFGMLHGVYCDPDAGEVARVNALELCKRVQDELTPSAQSVLLDRHQDYRAKGDEKRHRASQQFFQHVGLMALLSEAEVHRLITSASRDLLRVHNGFSNFYNEPPFADRLVRLTRDIGVPRSAQPAFVEAVITCAVGNPYGVSNGAVPSYRSLVSSFSPREISLMLELPRSQKLVASRMKHHAGCKENYRALVGLLDRSSVPTNSRAAYRRWRDK